MKMWIVAFALMTTFQTCQAGMKAPLHDWNGHKPNAMIVVSGYSEDPGGSIQLFKPSSIPSPVWKDTSGHPVQNMINMICQAYQANGQTCLPPTDHADINFIETYIGDADKFNPDLAMERLGPDSPGFTQKQIGDIPPGAKRVLLMTVPTRRLFPRVDILVVSFDPNTSDTDLRTLGLEDGFYPLWNWR